MDVDVDVDVDVDTAEVAAQHTDQASTGVQAMDQGRVCACVAWRTYTGLAMNEA